VPGSSHTPQVLLDALDVEDTRTPDIATPAILIQGLASPSNMDLTDCTASPADKPVHLFRIYVLGSDPQTDVEESGGHTQPEHDARPRRRLPRRRRSLCCPVVVVDASTIPDETTTSPISTRSLETPTSLPSGASGCI
jgi:hypothetical protein